MGTSTRMIVLELNELTPSLMQRFMAEGKLPNFSRFYREANIYTTTAEETPPHLDPWIQWVTVHTGLNFRDHGLQRLNEGHTLKTPRIWDLMNASGKRVWICGSMNVGTSRPVGGAVMPDPWTTLVRPFPEALEPYFAFVQRQVMEHTSEQRGFGVRELSRFLLFMVTHGLSPDTIGAVVRQLTDERRSGARWKRAALLDQLQFDVFSWYWRRLRPDFATFFLNSTAHYQHLYWREMDPSAFTAPPTEAHSLMYRTAIEYGYRQMDRLVGRVLGMVDGNTTIVMATALSQQPCLMFESHGGKNFYRPAEWSRITALAGITDPYTASPVMAHQFHLYFDSPAVAERAAERLTAVRFGDRQALAVAQNGAGLFVGCRIYEPLTTKARLTFPGHGDVAFFDVFYKVDGVKSGMHHPDGMLWIRTPFRQHAVHTQHVPLAAIAPTILEHFGLQRPAYMSAPVGEWSRAPLVSATA
ncbi:MAG TPA: hypothetical protein VIX63_02295 [Vicinamibacterales bacterium]